ncbi:hypothetical protein AeMF1_000849 [Aphanomyces euteiches]|nr:hypothetical protein AeMF1_000849 [Aphanomyces euteiches]
MTSPAKVDKDMEDRLHSKTKLAVNFPPADVIAAALSHSESTESCKEVPVRLAPTKSIIHHHIEAMDAPVAQELPLKGPDGTRESLFGTKLHMPQISETRMVQSIPHRPPVSHAIQQRGADSNGLIVGYWKDGICDCYTHWFPNVIMSFLCPCVALAQVTQRIGLLHYRATLTLLGTVLFAAILCILIRSIELYHGDQFMTNKLIHIGQEKNLSMEDTVSSALDIMDVQAHSASRATTFLALGLTCSSIASLLVWYVRAVVRDGFRIPGNCVEDMVFSFFCPCCVIAQAATQCEAYEKKLSFRPRDVLQGYVIASFQVAPFSPPSVLSGNFDQ